MESKLAEFISRKAEEAVSQKLESAAFMNIPPVGQPAQENEITKGDDVRVLEAMRVSVYDPERTGVVNDSRLLDGQALEDIQFDLRLHFLLA